MSRASVVGAAALWMVCGGGLPGSALVAQEAATPSMTGEVVLAGEPLDGAMVVLHRVTAAEEGEIDSIRSGPQGRFSFDLPTVPDPGGRGEIYLASVEHLGITYFGAPVHTAVQLDTTYTIAVHDTAVAPAGGLDVPLDVRYLVFEPLDEERWRVTDLYRIEVPGDRTVVPGTTGAPVFTYPVPSPISEFEMGSSDLPPDAAMLLDDTMILSGPLTPGEKTFLVRYVVEGLDLTIPTRGTTTEMEILIREPAPSVDVTGMQTAPPVETDPGLRFRRFTAANVGATAIVMEAGALPGAGNLPRNLAVVMTLLLVAVGAYLASRRTGEPAMAGAPAGGQTVRGAAVPGGPGGSVGAPRGSGTPTTRRALIFDVAQVDLALEAEGLSAEEEERLRRRRAALIRRIQDLG